MDSWIQRPCGINNPLKEDYFLVYFFDFCVFGSKGPCGLFLELPGTKLYGTKEKRTWEKEGQ